MGPGWDRTRDPWICSQTHICCQSHYGLCYVAQLCIHVQMIADIDFVWKWHIIYLQDLLHSSRKKTTDWSTEKCITTIITLIYIFVLKLTIFDLINAHTLISTHSTLWVVYNI